MAQETNIVKVNVEPDVNLLKKRYDTIQKIKSDILNDNDFVVLKNGTKATRKSGWLKYAVAFGLSFEIISERKEIDETSKKFTYHVMVRCKDPTGARTAEALGSCTINEKSTFTTEHIVRAMADTRATERAIIKMLGTNEQAAEDLPNEMVSDTMDRIFCKCQDPKPKFQEPHDCATCGIQVRPDLAQKILNKK
jgi:hypothetical protein